MFVHINFIDDAPEFGMIEFILVDKLNEISFIVKKMQTVTFLTHFQAFEIVGTMTWALIERKNLLDYVCSNSNVLADGKNNVIVNSIDSRIHDGLTHNMLPKAFTSKIETIHWTL
ncbi:hypothetical protein PV326_002051 [Microctonus aethiopoides]|nr:hypothetical protein PV326_002051 [Microctonus aethiopoides]